MFLIKSITFKIKQMWEYGWMGALADKRKSTDKRLYH